MKNNSLRKAVLYCRVSTKEQVEEGNSLVTQERICKDYALKHGYLVDAVFIEQGESAKTADRTELQKLLKYCSVKKHGISIVIVYKLDRLSRNIDDYSQIRILLKRYGVEIKSTTEHFEDNPAGRFMENIIANVAQFDNEVRTERSVNGMKEAMREGRYVWPAPIGFSHCKINGKSTVAPNEYAPLVKKIFERVAYRLESLEEIRKKIQKEVLNGTGHSLLSKSYFYRILRNEIYTGWIIKFGERHKGAFTPIVSEELFAKVQQSLKHPSRLYRSYEVLHKDFPLRRFTVSSSGELLTGSWSQGKYRKYPYYRFPIQKMNLSKEKTENLFAAFLDLFQLSSSDLHALKAYLLKSYETQITDATTHVVNTKQETEALKSKRDLLIEKNLKGILSDELLKEKLEEISALLYDLESKQNAVVKHPSNLSNLLPLIQGILKNPGKTWLNLTFAEKILLQWFYFPEGVVFDGKIFRTPKTALIFNVKEGNKDLFSPKVHHEILTTNTYRVLNIPSLETLSNKVEHSGITALLKVGTLLEEVTSNS
ncbi:MAG: recombinase family protein [Lacibacter sp.]|jgi:DNA invertase Pin-like site-specific DNA recombinase